MFSYLQVITRTLKALPCFIEDLLCYSYCIKIYHISNAKKKSIIYKE